MCTCAQILTLFMGSFFVHSQTVLFSTYFLSAIITLNYLRRIQIEVAGQSLGKTPNLKNILMKKFLSKKI